MKPAFLTPSWIPLPKLSYIFGEAPSGHPQLSWLGVTRVSDVPRAEVIVTPSLAVGLYTSSDISNVESSGALAGGRAGGKGEGRGVGGAFHAGWKVWSRGFLTPARANSNV